MKNALVLGAGGFIGNHLVSRLKQMDYTVTGVDLKLPEFSISEADHFILGDLRNFDFTQSVFQEGLDEVYQLAADMGGAGYVFSGLHDADIMSNSVMINLNVAKVAILKKVKTLFYASSACIYPEYNQMNPESPLCSEESAYPAQPDSEYGWEKLFSERLYLSYRKNYGLNVKIARFHNIYGPKGSWNDGKEKAPAALCRKIAMASEQGTIEIWGDGLQTRSFLYIEDCLDAVLLLMYSSLEGPLNIGSEEMITIKDLSQLIQQTARKNVHHQFVSGPTGVRGRCSDNRQIRNGLGWEPKISLKEGISILLPWIQKQIFSCLKPTENERNDKSQSEQFSEYRFKQ